jgi:predicted tellurium resistance membrane protein TerC
MSVIAFFITSALAEFITFNTSWMVGVAFLLLGLRNLLSKPSEDKPLALWPVIVIGLIMSIDAVVATAALTLEVGSMFIIPVAVAIGHFAYLYIGSFFMRFIKTSHKVSNIISAVCLMLVGVLNIIEAL